VIAIEALHNAEVFYRATCKLNLLSCACVFLYIGHISHEKQVFVNVLTLINAEA